MFFLLPVIKIETYWNVNHTPDKSFTKLSIIKIETYWNVNYL